MGLVETLDELKEILDKKGIDRKEFTKQIEYAINKANQLLTFANDNQTYNDVIELVAFHTADGDKHMTELIRVLINTYIKITKGLDAENHHYFKELIFQYLLK